MVRKGLSAPGTLLFFLDYFIRSNRLARISDLLQFTVHSAYSLFGSSWACGRGWKQLALRPQKPLRLIRDGEIGGSGILYLTPTRYTVTTRMILH